MLPQFLQAKNLSLPILNYNRTARSQDKDCGKHSGTLWKANKAQYILDLSWNNAVNQRDFSMSFH